jgi:N-acetylglucosaminyldiphosphoundecaprenol N-acetyl-beta-D-mannosaminyltransferase
MRPPFDTVELCGMPIASVDGGRLVDHVFDELRADRGGWLVTANLDFMRRYVRDPAARALYASADVRVADGMPLVWASWLLGTPLPERVAGSALVVPMCARAAREQQRVYLLGGDPAANEAAAQRLLADMPGLAIVGRSAPKISAEPTLAELEPVLAELRASQASIVFVAFGSPKQERVIAALRAELPQAWWIGVGISFSFVAGHVKRAPLILQRLGLEWLHRLAQEPRRLFRRYLLEDLPFAFELLAVVTRDRLRKLPRIAE